MFAHEALNRMLRVRIEPRSQSDSVIESKSKNEGEGNDQLCLVF